MEAASQPDIYPLEFSYDKADSTVVAYVIGLNEHNRSLQYRVNEVNGQITILQYLFKLDQLEYIDITAVNINDYFEKTDWGVEYVSYNAFNEPTYTEFTRYYKLKDEYTNRYLPYASDIAIEFRLKKASFSNSVIEFNHDTNEIKVEYGKRLTDQYNSQESHETPGSMGCKYKPDSNEINFYYLLGQRESMTIFGNKNIVVDGSTYTEKSNWTEYCMYEDIIVERSATTLAFIKASP